MKRKKEMKEKKKGKIQTDKEKLRIVKKLKFLQSYKKERTNVLNII